MLYLDYPDKDIIASAHFEAVKAYVSSKDEATIDSLYSEIRCILTDLPASRDIHDYTWLSRFILADQECLDRWAASASDKLQFLFFKQLYLNRFAKDPETYVDNAKRYNAYTMLKHIKINVCPYCDDEHIDVFDTVNGERRTSDIDHFHPKGIDQFPALAMCFFNLIPSGKGCNQVMNNSPIEATPYHPDIESWSKFYQDTPPGRNPDTLNDDELKIRFITSHGMTRNNAVLGIEERYNHRKSELRSLFQLKYLLQPENIKEKEKMGISKDTILLCLGGSYKDCKGSKLHSKLRYDLLGF